MAAVLGIFSSVLGIISFGINNFPTHSSDKSVVRIQVGLDGTSGDQGLLDAAGGNNPNIRLWNNVGEEIGSSTDNGDVEDGGYYDITVEQDNSQQPTYGLFTAGSNAICIAYVGITWPDDSKYGWVGNWAQQCGHSWYPSGIYIDGKNIDCGWIDSDGSSGPETAFQVHFPDFNDKGNGYNQDPNFYCTSNPTLQYFTTPNYGDNGEEIAIYVKRDEVSSASTTKGLMQRRSKPVGEDRIVISHLPEHAATRVCESDTSVGPDFVSMAEGIFCDMDTKTSHSLCKSTDQGDCFDLDTKKFHGADGKVKRSNKYSKVVEWSA